MILKSLYSQHIQRIVLAVLVVMVMGCSASASNHQTSRQINRPIDIAAQPTHTARLAPATDGGSTCTSANFQSEMLSRINQIRAVGAVCGNVVYPPAGPMRWSTKLQQAATVHSSDMASNNFFNHKSATNGTTLPERLRAVGYKYQSAGENIGAGQTSVEQVIAVWLASPGHCVTMMTAQFVDLGVSCKMNTNSYYKTYWTLKAAVPS